METVIIFKQDGTIQCEDEPPRPLAEDADILRSIGVSKICGRINTPGPMVVAALCGLPTNQVNAFAVPREDWDRVRRGVVGTMGFRLWVGAAYPSIHLDDGCELGAAEPEGIRGASTQPVLVRDLIGLQLRSYVEGDVLTTDYLPDRVNIELDGTRRRIRDVWMG